MIDKQVNLELMQFIESNILPQYQAFDKAHNMEHVTGVIRRSLVIAKQLGADINMAYTIAAYHDLGLSGPRAVHHLTSGKILLADQRLKKWFSQQQIVIMKEAVEDHRASASRAPRSLYGKIIAEADRDLAPETVIRRTIQFGMSHYPTLSPEEQWERCQQHLNEKYGHEGYIKLWLPRSPNHQHLQKLREIINHPEELKAIFSRIYEEERKATEQT